MSDRSSIEEAKANGLNILLSNSRLLLLDIDTLEDLTFAKKQLKILSGFLKIKSIEYNLSKSDHFHVKVNLTEDIEDLKHRVMLQACLGSDRKKELLSLLNIHNKEEQSILLFTTNNPWMELKF